MYEMGEKHSRFTINLHEPAGRDRPVRVYRFRVFVGFSLFFQSDNTAARGPSLARVVCRSVGE